MNSASRAATPARRTKPKGRHPDRALSAAFVRTAGPGRYCDGQGLYLFVQPSGTRSWVQRLVVRGRRQELGLGSALLVPLSEAREKAL
ncbi:MAG: Arm DNA-binding domain-containing protein, partial [Acidobacteria bacterium]|nr:Arm DNA-binding domain-containing protein [Acidobacteriota bacterium]